MECKKLFLVIAIIIIGLAVSNAAKYKEVKSKVKGIEVYEKKLKAKLVKADPADDSNALEKTAVPIDTIRKLDDEINAVMCKMFYLSNVTRRVLSVHAKQQTDAIKERRSKLFCPTVGSDIFPVNSKDANQYMTTPLQAPTSRSVTCTTIFSQSNQKCTMTTPLNAKPILALLNERGAKAPKRRSTKRSGERSEDGSSVPVKNLLAELNNSIEFMQSSKPSDPRQTSVHLPPSSEVESSIDNVLMI